MQLSWLGRWPSSQYTVVFVLVLVFVLVVVFVFVFDVLVFVVFVFDVLVFVVFVFDVFVFDVLVFVVFVFDVLVFVLVFPVIRSQIARSGFVLTSESGVVTVGASKSGIVDPPGSTVAVPVGETKIMLAFEESAEAHGISQKVTDETTSVRESQGPDVARPRASKRIVTVELGSGSTMFVLPREAKFTVRVSVAKSRTPFWS